MSHNAKNMINDKYGGKIMTDKSSREQLEAIDMFNKTVEQFDKDIEQFDKGIERSDKETKIYRIVKMIEEFKEGRMVLSSPLKEFKIEDFEVEDL